MLRQQQTKVQAALEQARVSGSTDQIRALEKTLKRLKQVSSLCRQAVPELRAEGEWQLALLRALDQSSRHQLQA